MHSSVARSESSRFSAFFRSCCGAGVISSLNSECGVTSLAVAAFFAMGIAGCSLVPGRSKTPTLHFQTKSGSTIDQKGDAAKPANVSEATTRSEIAIPAGSKIDVVPATANTPGKITFALSSSSVFSSVTDSQHVEGPIAQAPPSTVEIARGQAVLYSYALAGGLMLLALLLFYLEHGKAGAIALLGAGVVPVLSNLLSNSVALAIGGIALAISLTLYTAWHLHGKTVAPEIQKLREQLEVKIRGDIASIK